jgi:hypothetical protein
MQFVVIYLKTWGGTEPYVAFSTPEFHSCFFVFGRTCMAPNSLTLHKPVSVLFCISVFSWLMDGAYLPYLAVKTLSGEGSMLMWGGSVITHWVKGKGKVHPRTGHEGPEGE